MGRVPICVVVTLEGLQTTGPKTLLERIRTGFELKGCFHGLSMKATLKLRRFKFDAGAIRMSGPCHSRGTREVCLRCTESLPQMCMMTRDNGRASEEIRMRHLLTKRPMRRTFAAVPLAHIRRGRSTRKR